MSDISIMFDEPLANLDLPKRKLAFMWFQWLPLFRMVNTGDRHLKQRAQLSEICPRIAAYCGFGHETVDKQHVFKCFINSCGTSAVLVMYVCISTTHMFALYGGISVYSFVKYVCLYVCLWTSHARIYVCITVYMYGLCERNMQIYNDVHMSRNHRTHCVGITQCCCFSFCFVICFDMVPGADHRSLGAGTREKPEREAVWILEVLSFFCLKKQFSLGSAMEYHPASS